ncbi:hypothetical protein BU17DRAFT_85254 [Hysterangium stoloniferum]|nr:hypothetical protein BU17DRAFT_85254 [Hysterangium stoloniferum]
MVTVPPTSSALVVVTGVGSQLGSHTALAALKAGYRVRGTSRNPDCADLVRAAFENNGLTRVHLGSHLEFMIVDDFASEAQWRRALSGADAVIHTALLLLRADLLVGPAISQVLAILHAAKKTPTVKMMVMSSTFSTIVTPGLPSDTLFTAEDWNEASLSMADEGETVSNEANPFHFYAAAKTRAAQAIWRFMDTEQPHFDVTGVLFGAIYGPTLSPRLALSQSRWIKFALDNDISPSRTIPTTWFTDVRDAAQLQILVLRTPELGGKRLIAGAAAYGWNDVFTILRQNFKSLTVPENFEGGRSSGPLFDNSIATKLIGTWTTLEKSLVDFGRSMGY